MLANIMDGDRSLNIKMLSLGHSFSSNRLSVPELLQHYRTLPAPACKNNKTVFKYQAKYSGYSINSNTRYSNAYKPGLLLGSPQPTGSYNRAPRPSNGKYKRIVTQPLPFSNELYRYIYTKSYKEFISCCQLRDTQSFTHNIKLWRQVNATSYIGVTVCCQLRETKGPTHYGRG